MSSLEHLLSLVGSTSTNNNNANDDDHAASFEPIKRLPDFSTSSPSMKSSVNPPIPCDQQNPQPGLPTVPPGCTLYQLNSPDGNIVYLIVNETEQPKPTAIAAPLPIAAVEPMSPVRENMRPNHGTNVHNELGGKCPFRSYRPGQRRHKPNPINGPSLQTLPIFVQMFPSELMPQAMDVLQDVITIVCGNVGGSVEEVEQRSETSFIAFVRTSIVWHLIYNLRYRVLMDRHGFWYAEDMTQYMYMKNYCESVRRLPQQSRHYKTDGLPCMPLVVELGRMVNRQTILAPPAPPTFDVLMPIGGQGQYPKRRSVLGTVPPEYMLHFPHHQQPPPPPPPHHMQHEYY